MRPVGTLDEPTARRRGQPVLVDAVAST